MTKTELESKHLADLHQLAAAAGVERFRMLSRAELIEKLSDGGGDENGSAAKDSDAGEERSQRPRPRPRRRRRFGRRREGITIQDLLLPAESGRQAVLLADSREAATALLR